ncbi:MAG: Eco57I restriction-modification methylase domain-containing protein, partial [Ktedonobacteraceae bacterium]
RGRRFLEKSVGDLSCGSGTFLVAAAARKSTILQKVVAAGEIEPDYALHLLTETFLGFDLNPFACYLAEINLLIQCLPLLLNKEGQLCRSVDRFHIYCTDALEPTVAEQLQALVDGTATERLTFPERATRPRGKVVSDDERAVLRIKDTKGLPTELTQLDLNQQGLDYLLGNPPYVSAGESEDNLRYRNNIWNFGTYQLLHQRWDLFVPFFERNLQFLRPETGRLGLIVSKGIETEGYAEKLRQLLSSQYRILQIDFFPGLRLFQDAAIENTIVLVENRALDEEHEVIRRRHLQTDGKQFETLPPIPQLDANGQLFRWRYDRLLDKSLAEGSIPLCAIVYIGTGVEAQSKETSDPVVDGRRQKLFTLDDVFLPPSAGSTRPPEYTEDGVLGDDVDRYYLRQTRYVAYEKYRSQMRRRRNVALFRTAEKLLLGETSGGYYDRSGLFANHSVQVVVSWKVLEASGAIEEKGIKTVLRESRQIAAIPNSLSPIAELFDLRYLLGVINSRFIRQYIAANRLEGTREGRIYPDVWKRLPIKVTTTERQQQIAALVDEIQAQYRQLASLPTPAILAANPAILYRDIQAYLLRQDLRFVGDIQSIIAEKPTIREGRLILRRQPLAYLDAPDAPELLRYIELYLTQLHPELQGRTWAEARQHIHIPSTLAVVHTFMASLDSVSLQEKQIRSTIDTLLSHIDILIETAYSEPADAGKMEIINKKRSTINGNGLF